tara:strand:- start:1259 stop:2023 length:765 start_codon:yes stop_codon:yes gene_type:complete
MEFKTIKGKKHYLYESKEEFYIKSELDIPIRQDWRQGAEGDWVLTDDNYVCQILKCFKVGKNECVRTVCGTFRLNNKKGKMLGAKGVADHIYSFSGTYVPSKGKKDNDRHFLFAKYIARGCDVIEAFKKAYPDAKSEKYIKTQATSLLKRENVKKMVKEEIREILDEEGVTPQYLIRGYKQVADIAEKDTDRLRSLDSLSKISGMFDTQENKTEELTVWAGFTPEQMDAIKDNKGLKNGKAKLLAKAERETKEI